VTTSQLQLTTAAGCGLAIAGYPRFSYDARGGGGIGQLGPADGAGRQPLLFDAIHLAIPALHWRNTRVLGLPLPPGLSIRIAAEHLEGELEPASGALSLRFRARYRFRIAGLYRAPDLQVNTLLHTGAVHSQRHHCSGEPLNANGSALLVGVAMVPPSGDPWLDRFLGLPDEALAMLRCSITPLPCPAPGC
jgi:hypothetical protein